MSTHSRFEAATDSAATDSAATDGVAVRFEMTSISGDSETPVVAALRYEPAEPFLVRACFTLPDDSSVEWVFDRELLREGIVIPSGNGDIRIYPGDPGLLMELRSPYGRAFLYGPIEPFIEFLGRIYRAVPDGCEQQFFSIDDELRALTGSDLDPGRHSSEPAN